MYNGFTTTHSLKQDSTGHNSKLIGCSYDKMKECAKGSANKYWKLFCILFPVVFQDLYTVRNPMQSVFIECWTIPALELLSQKYSKIK